MLKNLVFTYYKGNGGLPIFQALMGTKKRSKPVKVLFALLFVYLLCVYFFMVGSSFYSMALVSPFMMFVEALGLALMFGVMFSYSSVENILVKAKDLEFLTPLPIAKKTLTLSRFVILYLEVFAECIIVYIPFIAISIIKFKFDFLWYVLAIVSFLAVPVVATAFMALLAYIAAKYKLFHKVNIFFTYAVSILGVLFLVKQGMSPTAMETMMSSPILNNRISVSHLHFEVLAVTLTFVILGVALLVLANYSSHLKHGYETTNKKQLKAEGYKSSSVLIALLRRELNIIKSNSAFTSEIIMEQVIPVFLLVIYAIMGIAGDILSVLQIPMIANFKALIIIGVVCLFYTMSLLSSTSVSREGKEFYTMKVYPIEPKQRVDAKILFHLVFTSVFAIPILVIFLVIMKAPLLMVFLSIPFIICVELLVSAIGLNLDFSNPHLNWSTGGEAVKQNVNGIFSMLLCLVFIIVSGLIVWALIILKQPQSVMLLVLMTIYFIAFWPLRKLTVSRCKKAILNA